MRLIKEPPTMTMHQRESSKYLLSLNRMIIVISVIGSRLIRWKLNVINVCLTNSNRNSLSYSSASIQDLNDSSNKRTWIEYYFRRFKVNLMIRGSNIFGNKVTDFHYDQNVYSDNIGLILRKTYFIYCFFDTVTSRIPNQNMFDQGEHRWRTTMVSVLSNIGLI